MTDKKVKPVRAWAIKKEDGQILNNWGRNVPLLYDHKSSAEEAAHCKESVIRVEIREVENATRR